MKHGHTRLLVTILLLLMPGVPTRAQTSTAEFLPEFDDSRSTRLTRRPATLTSSCWRQAWLESQGSECIRLVSAVFRDDSTHKFAWNDGSEHKILFSILQDHAEFYCEELAERRTQLSNLLSLDIGRQNRALRAHLRLTSRERRCARNWWAREDSNLQPSDYEPHALTIELRARHFKL
jgi:hypothetical protein